MRAFICERAFNMNRQILTPLTTNKAYAFMSDGTLQLFRDDVCRLTLPDKIYKNLQIEKVALEGYAKDMRAFTMVLGIIGDCTYSIRGEVQHFTEKAPSYVFRIRGGSSKCMEGDYHIMIESLIKLLDDPPKKDSSAA